MIGIRETESNVVAVAEELQDKRVISILKATWYVESQKSMSINSNQFANGHIFGTTKLVIDWQIPIDIYYRLLNIGQGVRLHMHASTHTEHRVICSVGNLLQ